MIATRLSHFSLHCFLWINLLVADYSNVHTFRCSVLNDEDESKQALCSFVLEQDRSPPPPSSSSSSVSAASSLATTMEHCFDDYCVQVVVQTVPKRTLTSTSSSSETTRTTTSSSSATTTDAGSSHLPSTTQAQSTASDGRLQTLIVKQTARGIQIGEVTYQRPFSQYGEQINQALEGLLETFSLSSTIDMTEQLQEQAFWLVELGVSHRMFVAATIPSGIPPESTTTDLSNLEKSLNALHQAQVLFDQLQQHHRMQRTGSSSVTSNTIKTSKTTLNVEKQQLWKQETEVALANVHFHLGESYVLHPNLFQQALGHYRESERLFRGLVQQNENTSTARGTANSKANRKTMLTYDEADIRYNWAESCLQLASFLLNQQTSDDSDQVVADPADVSSSTTSTSTAASKKGTPTTTTRRTSRTTNSGGGTLFSQQQAQGQQQLRQLNELLKSAQEASGLLENAISVYRKQLTELSSSHDASTKKTRSKRSRFQLMPEEDEEQEEETANVYKMKLATALQHSATALTFLSTSSTLTSTASATGSTLSYKALLLQALERQEEALGLFRQVLTYAEKKANKFGDIDSALVASDLVFSIANALYGMSDLRLQLGQYDEAQKWYEETMTWYGQHANELPLPPLVENQAMGVEGDGTLEAYEQALEQYHDEMNEVSEQRLGKEDTHSDIGAGRGGDEDGAFDGEGSASWILDSAGDQTYEGDLHAALGSLRMARGEVALAIGHYDQAVRLYRASAFLSGDDEERSVADVHFNWAMALFRAGEYKESARIHGKALEGYRKVVGEGNNPLAVGMLGMNVEDLQQSASVASTDKDGKVADPKHSNDVAGSVATPPTVPLIDLNLFQSSMLNATTGDEL